MNDCYSPHTGEHIRTDNPADWMGRAGTPAPDYDPQAASAFWRGDRWEVVASATPQRTRADILQALAQIDVRSIRALREGDTARIDSLEAEAAALRDELSGLPS